jgi:hypothetical protein
MFKKILLITAVILMIGLLVFGAINRTLAKSEDTNTRQEGYGRSSAESSHKSAIPGFQAGQASGASGGGGGRRGGDGNRGNNGQSGTGALPAASGELSAAEAEALSYMREEEKLAHDVYLTLYEKWGLATFQNIANSEQVHTDAIKSLLDRYGLQDPASSRVGVFTNPELQALYNTLLAQGSHSLTEALKVGAAIEEIDILDLEERLAQTDNADIQQVFNNLLRGSRNHLRAFTSALQAEIGEVYQPQYLSPQAYQAIVGAGTEIGGQRGGGQGGNGYHGGRP